MNKTPQENTALPSIGGQAVMEGVMMRNERNGMMATSVRQGKGRYVKKVTRSGSPDAKKPWYRKWLFVRGVFNFIAMMKVGVTCLNDSVNMLGLDEEEPGKFEKWFSEKTGKNVMDVASSFAIVLGIGLAVVLFIIVPNLLTTWITSNVSASIVVNLIEGAIRLSIFIGYLLLISQMKDIKRFFAYHGAEHKTINAFERREKLTIENVQKQSTAHPRCGTSFLVFVMVISIIVFSLTGWSGQLWWQRLLMRIALLPVVASIAYELLMGMAKKDNLLVRILRWPGMQVQKLTTRQPDDEMVVTAIASALAVMDPEHYEMAAPEDYEFPPNFGEEAVPETTDANISDADDEGVDALNEDDSATA